MYKCFNFERELWFELVKCMWRKHQSVYQDHLKYIHNDIVKPFCIKIIRYANSVREIHDLAKYLPPPSTKGVSAEAAKCTVRNQEFMVSEVCLAIKDRLHSYMQDELEDHQEYYQSLTHEDWYTDQEDFIY